MTPYHCGSAEAGHGDQASYRDTAGYAGGITLGTALAISGAAANPNMGHFSSRLASLVMTLFNARLGAWLGNPGKQGDRTWKHKGPRSAMRWLLAEAFGLTSSQGAYVNLSDGGHFDNLGLYEVVRRKCRLVFVVDSGCDREANFSDLGDTLRKIRIDQGISVKFDEHQFRSVRERKQRWATATIRYAEVDPSTKDGMLVYLKPTLLGSETPDVQSYAAAHPDFPYESTADQFFDESQTESYRQLGFETIIDLCGTRQVGTVQELFDSLKSQSAMEMRTIPPVSTKHTIEPIRSVSF